MVQEAERLSVARRLLNEMATRPEGVSRSELKEIIGGNPDHLKRNLTRLISEDKAFKNEADVWWITDKGMEWLGKKKPPGGDKGIKGDIEERESIPSDLDAFIEICLTVGAGSDKFIEKVADYLFRGDPNDLEWVWNTISTFFRIDFAKKVMKLWTMRLKIPMPDELREKVESTEGEMRITAEKGSARRKNRYSVIGNEIFIDPDGEFDNPLAAAQFASASKSLKGGGEEGITAAAIKAMADLAGGNQSVDPVALAQAMKPNLEEIISLAQLIAGPPGGGGETKKPFLEQAKDFMATSGMTLADILGLVKKTLGISDIEQAIGTLASRETKSVSLPGMEGLNVDEAIRYVGFVKKEAREDKKLDQEIKDKEQRTSLLGEVRKTLPQFVKTAEGAVRRMETEAARRGPARPAPDASKAEEAPQERQVILEGACPECGKILQAPKENPAVVCDQCGCEFELVAKEGQ